MDTDWLDHSCWNGGAGTVIVGGVREDAVPGVRAPGDLVAVGLDIASGRRCKVAGCLFSANAQNPMGFTMGDDAKRRIVALSRRYGVPLIENDIWGDTVYDPDRALPAKGYDRDGLRFSSPAIA